MEGGNRPSLLRRLSLAASPRGKADTSTSPRVPSISAAVESATNEQRNEFPDLSAGLDLCDFLNQSRALGKEAARSLRRRLAHRSPRVQVLSLALLELLMKNCPAFHVQVADSGILHDMASLATKKGSSPEVKQKILELVDTWQLAFGGAAGHPPQYYAAYTELLAAGEVFPERPAEAPFHTPPAHGPGANQPQHASPSQPGSAQGQLRSRSMGNVRSNAHAAVPALDSLTALGNARSTVELLSQMLNVHEGEGQAAGVSANGSDAELVAELHSECRAMQQQLQEALGVAADEEFLAQGLQLNEELQQVLAKHDRALVRKRFQELGIPPLSGTPTPTPAVMLSAQGLGPVIQAPSSLTPTPDIQEGSSPAAINNPVPPAGKASNWAAFPTPLDKPLQASAVVAAAEPPRSPLIATVNPEVPGSLPTQQTASSAVVTAAAAPPGLGLSPQGALKELPSVPGTPVPMADNSDAGAVVPPPKEGLNGSVQALQVTSVAPAGSPSLAALAPPPLSLEDTDALSLITPKSRTSWDRLMSLPLASPRALALAPPPPPVKSRAKGGPLAEDFFAQPLTSHSKPGLKAPAPKAGFSALPGAPPKPPTVSEKELKSTTVAGLPNPFASPVSTLTPGGVFSPQGQMALTPALPPALPASPALPQTMPAGQASLPAAGSEVPRGLAPAPTWSANYGEDSLLLEPELPQGDAAAALLNPQQQALLFGGGVKSPRLTAATSLSVSPYSLRSPQAPSPALSRFRSFHGPPVASPSTAQLGPQGQLPLAVGALNPGSDVLISSVVPGTRPVQTQPQAQLQQMLAFYHHQQH